jgi:hypothetical protein
MRRGARAGRGARGLARRIGHTRREPASRLGRSAAARTARLAALDESLATGSWLRSTPPRNALQGRRAGALLPTLQGDARAAMVTRTSASSTPALPRVVVERAGSGRLAHRRAARGRRGCAQLRVVAGPMLPEGYRRGPVSPAPGAPRAETAPADAARDALRAQHDAPRLDTATTRSIATACGAVPARRAGLASAAERRAPPDRAAIDAS